MNKKRPGLAIKKTKYVGFRSSKNEVNYFLSTLKKLAIKLLPRPNANLYIPVKMLYLTMIKKAYKEKFHYNYATFVKSILIGCKMLKIESD